MIPTSFHLPLTRHAPRLLAAALGVYLCGLAGCNLYSHKVWRPPPLAEFELSAPSTRTFRAAGVCQRFNHDPQNAVADLTAAFIAGPRDPNTAFSLAEGNYLAAREAERARSDACVDHYFMAAAFAWHCLFAADAPAHPDPRHLRSVALYNSSVAKCVETAQRFGRIESCARLRVNTPGGAKAIPLDYVGFVWTPEEIGRLIVVGNYEADELSRRYIHRGLGGPMIGIRRRVADGPAERFYPEILPCAVTAVLRPNLDALLCAGQAPTDGGRLELHDPTKSSALVVAGRPINMAADLSAPWALTLWDPQRTSLEIGGFFSPESTAASTGLYMLEPYQPHKIPLVLIHGLFSGPLTWTDLINELRADPHLRERFQLWAFRYPSGGPLLHAAAQLRQELQQIRQAVDTEGRDVALDHMVLMGHSLGGLISKLQATYSGCTLWQHYANRPLETLNLTDADRGGLGRWFFFNAQPFVRRVVYFATPHRGTRARNRYAGRLAANFVSLPEANATARRIIAANPGAFRTSADGLLATSAELLAPDDRLSVAIRRLPMPDHVRFHSVIGSGQTLWDGSDSDGVVSVESARVVGVASECLVRTAHGSVHRHPHSVAEVKRILREHLREFDHAPAR